MSKLENLKNHVFCVFRWIWHDFFDHFSIENFQTTPIIYRYYCLLGPRAQLTIWGRTWYIIMDNRSFWLTRTINWWSEDVDILKISKSWIQISKMSKIENLKNHVFRWILHDLFRSIFSNSKIYLISKIFVDLKKIRLIFEILRFCDFGNFKMLGPRFWNF